MTPRLPTPAEARWLERYAEGRGAQMRIRARLRMVAMGWIAGPVWVGYYRYEITDAGREALRALRLRRDER